MKKTIIATLTLSILTMLTPAQTFAVTMDECESVFGLGTPGYQECIDGATDGPNRGRGNIGDLGSADKLGIPENRSFEASDLRGILNTVFGILGGVAVIFVIVGGLKYVIGSGKPDDLQKAKNTILYAVVGLVISLFAMAIVNFVISSL